MKKIPTICPGCSSSISIEESFYLCTNQECAHSKIDNCFNVINDVPVLISDILCDTVCDPKETRSYVKRSSGKVNFLKKIFIGESKITKKNCESFIRKLKENTKKPKILVIGSGESGSGTDLLWQDKDLEIHGVDIYVSKTVDVVCDAHYLPLESKYYDGVWIQAVLEHVVEPQKVVKEIHRVLSNNGIVYAETPFMQQVHEGAYDYHRYTVLGHRYLFKDFSIISIGGNKGPEIALSWAIKYFVWSITRSQKMAKLFGFLSRIILRPFGYLVSKESMFDASSGVYFFGYKNKGSNVTHKSLVDLYKGHKR